MQYTGINLSGAEFGNVGQAFGTGYTYPTATEIDYYAAKGLNTIRVPFLWERLQPTLNGALDPDELKRLDAVVTYAASKGITVDLDVHNYGSYRGAQIGGSAVPNSAFADLWGKIASHYASNPKVMFGLMNEPQQASASAWLGSQNAAIGAIRAAGAKQEILVSGVGWDGAWTWTGSGTQNAAVIGSGVVDPLHNYAFEVHQYLDADGSGTHRAVVSADIGVSRLQDITKWAEATGSKLFLGEFGVANDPTSLKAMGNMLAYMNQHTAAWQGATYWAGGPWWGDYMYSAEPTGGVDSAQIGVLQQAVAPSLAITAQVLQRDTGASATDNITSNGAVTLTGTAAGPAGTIVQVLDGTAVLGTAALAGSGSWSFATTLTAGAHALKAATVDASGRMTATASAAPITVLTAAPVLAIASQTIAADGRTATISGSVAGPAGTTVSVSAGTTALGLATLDGKGGWSLSAGLAPGDTRIVAIATDPAGNAASASLGLTVPQPPAVPSPDTLVLNLSEDAYGGDAQYTVSVDGRQIGGIRTATASHKLGQSQDVTVTGTFGAGMHKVGVDFLNDAYGGSADTDRNLYVNTLTLNGTRTVVNATQWSQGQVIYAASTVPALKTSAPALDTLVVNLSEDAYGGDAQYTVSVDGMQIGGTRTVTALHKLGQSQDVSLTGAFGPGAHTVGVTFLNDAYGGSAETDRNLYVNALTLNGARTVVNTTQWSQGQVTYAVPTSSSTPLAATASRLDSLVLTMSEDAYAGDARFTVKVDGKQVGGIQTATALEKLGQFQDFILAGRFGAGAHTVGVDFMNDAYGGSADTDRNLHLKAVTLNGTRTEIGDTLYQQGVSNYQVSMPSTPPAKDPLTVGAGATLILDADASAGAAVSFAGPGSSAQLYTAGDLKASFTGFGAGDTIDLPTIAFPSGASAYQAGGASGTLTLSDGAHKASLAFQGSYGIGNFHVGNDNHGGTAVTFVA